MGKNFCLWHRQKNIFWKHFMPEKNMFPYNKKMSRQLVARFFPLCTLKGKKYNHSVPLFKFTLTQFWRASSIKVLQPWWPYDSTSVYMYFTEVNLWNIQEKITLYATRTQLGGRSLGIHDVIKWTIGWRHNTISVFFMYNNNLW